MLCLHPVAEVRPAVPCAVRWPLNKRGNLQQVVLSHTLQTQVEVSRSQLLQMSTRGSGVGCLHFSAPCHCHGFSCSSLQHQPPTSHPANHAACQHCHICSHCRLLQRSCDLEICHYPDSLSHPGLPAGCALGQSKLTGEGEQWEMVVVRCRG